MYTGYILPLTKIHPDGIACLAFILPLIDIREWMESRDSLIMLTHFDYSVVLPEIVVGSKAAGTGNQVFILSEWIKYIYLAGIALLTIRFFIQVVSLYRIICTRQRR